MRGDFLDPLWDSTVPGFVPGFVPTTSYHTVNLQQVTLTVPRHGSPLVPSRGWVSHVPPLLEGDSGIPGGSGPRVRFEEVKPPDPYATPRGWSE